MSRLLESMFGDVRACAEASAHYFPLEIKSRHLIVRLALTLRVIGPILTSAAKPDEGHVAYFFISASLSVFG